MINTKQAKKILGVHSNTLRSWANAGKIKCIRGPGNHRLYDVDDFLKRQEGKDNRRAIIYARVSSKNQKDDIENQIRYLRERYPKYELIEDVGSGLNFKRKGFITLLESIMRGTVAEVVVSHRDRLCRFGFEIINIIAKQNNTKILVLDNTQLSPAEELTRDLISIIHVFSCRIYGLRKYTNKIKEDKDLSYNGKQKDT